ncbi:hypothetical protein DFH27DRAFT_618468 [Peziza echinospora]|nr:hypothetical protein DFH27DRAFT_618468 [Peziza echinospora]
MRDYAQTLRRFARELDTERTIYENTCSELLADIVSPTQLNSMMEDPHDEHWRNSKFTPKLKARLGQSVRSLNSWLWPNRDLHNDLVILAEAFNKEETDVKLVQALSSVKEHARLLHSILQDDLVHLNCMHTAHLQFRMRLRPMLENFAPRINTDQSFRFGLILSAKKGGTQLALMYQALQLEFFDAKAEEDYYNHKVGELTFTEEKDNISASQTGFTCSSIPEWSRILGRRPPGQDIKFLQVGIPHNNQHDRPSSRSGFGVRGILRNILTNPKVFFASRKSTLRSTSRPQTPVPPPEKKLRWADGVQTDASNDRAVVHTLTKVKVPLTQRSATYRVLG